jgi:hypothetical protein
MLQGAYRGARVVAVCKVAFFGRREPIPAYIAGAPVSGHGTVWFHDPEASVDIETVVHAQLGRGCSDAAPLALLAIAYSAGPLGDHVATSDSGVAHHRA